MATDERSGKDFAARYNTLTWQLLSKLDRTADDDQRMIHAAHASHMHWLEVGTDAHHQRALWLLARVYAELGIAAEALRYAQLCDEVTEATSDTLLPFDLVYRTEALARASAVNGDRAKAHELRERALEAGSTLPDEKTRDLVLADIKAGNWGILD